MTNFASPPSEDREAEDEVFRNFKKSPLQEEVEAAHAPFSKFPRPKREQYDDVPTPEHPAVTQALQELAEARAETEAGMYKTEPVFTSPRITGLDSASDTATLRMPADEHGADFFKQPKITGYRQLTQAEVALMNEGKALAEEVGAYIEKLRSQMTPEGERALDQRWISIGATQLQQGFMAVIRGIAQPTTF